MKTREEIITSMCYTFRHDFGLDKDIGNGFISELSAGITADERKFIWNQMAQIFDNDIQPLFDEYQRLVNSDSVVLPKNKEHAENMVRVGMFYLENNK